MRNGKGKSISFFSFFFRWSFGQISFSSSVSVLAYFCFSVELFSVGGCL